MARSPWLEKFREGSFRGVPFKTDSHEFSSGRRKVDHEFPQREQNRSEDLGRRTPRFTLELLVIGDDYFAERDALTEALDLPGAGELVHPYLGRKIVQVGSYSVREAVSEGRLARLTVEFSEAGSALFPDSKDDELSKLDTNAGNVIDDSATAFETLFSIANSPAHVVEAASDAVKSVGDFMTKSVNKFTQPIDNLTFAISNFKADVDNLLATPGKLADRIKDTFAALLAEFEGDPETGNKVLGNFSTFDSEFTPVVGTTPSNVTQAGNQTATINVAKQMAFGNQAVLVADIDFLSIKEATEIRDNVVGNLDTQLEEATDDELFQSLQDLQASLTKAIPAEGLQDLIEFTPAITLPALVISHRLFQTVEKEDEIIDQNDISHPAFVPGGQVIEVSGDG
jgi:prophage DNA circulation protein